MTKGSDKKDVIDLTAVVVCAFVSNNALPVDELPGLLVSVYSSLRSLKAEEAADEPATYTVFTPEDYLANAYPMVAPAYSDTRATRDVGLGRKQA